MIHRRDTGHWQGRELLARIRTAFLPPLALVSLGLSLFLSSCTSHPTSPDPSGLEEIRMRVTGGFAGVDYTVVLDGPTGTLRGEESRGDWPFQPGEVLQVLHRDQVRYISSLFLEAGVHRMEDVDFGYTCCDFFHVAVSFLHAQGGGGFRGDTPNLPPEVAEAVAVLHGLVWETLPVMVDFGTQPGLWPQDPFTVLEAAVLGDRLRVKVQYGGGCKTHAFQGVAWGRWMESHPVQVRLFLSHDAFQDPCRALITEDRFFDLGPLRRAYQKSYGTSSPGTTTLIIVLENHSGSQPPWVKSLQYRF